MTDDAFDAALVAAAFDLGAEQGWRMVTPAAACQQAGLDLATTRTRFPTRAAILERFGTLADEHALHGAAADGTARDRLFDSLLRRFDFLQMHRPGVLALIKALPFDPGLALWLAGANLRSMGWLLEGAGLSAGGARGAVRAQGLLAIWGWGLRAWMRDESADLSATMAAVDVALNRADQIAERFDPRAAPAPVDMAQDPAGAAARDIMFAAEESGPPAAVNL